VTDSGKRDGGRVDDAALEDLVVAYDLPLLRTQDGVRVRPCDLARDLREARERIAEYRIIVKTLDERLVATQRDRNAALGLLRDLWPDVKQAVDHDQVGDGPPWPITVGLSEALTGLANTITWRGGREKIDARLDAKGGRGVTREKETS
jgi:hypothetical protein